MNLSTLTPDFLEEKRNHADPLADMVIAQIIERGFQERINEVFFMLVSNHSYTPEMFKGLPTEVFEIVDQYFSATGTLPSWANKALITTGQEVFSLFGPEIFMLLNVKSLPLCYTCKKGAKVLHMTGRLSDRKGNIDPLARRLMETAQMVVNTMSPGGLNENGTGIITIQKVRLIHASIRYFLKHEKFNPQGWDVKENGEPINQEDLAGTLMSFGPVIISGLQQMGIKLTDAQQQGYMHCWKIIGHMMGMQDDLLPDTFEQGWGLAVKILKHQAAASPEGKELTSSCIHFLKYVTPGNFFDDVPEYMMGFFTEDTSKATGLNLAEMIGVNDPGNAKDRIIFLLSKLFIGEVGNLERHSEIIKKISSTFYKVLLQGFLQHYNDGKRVHFFIPPALQTDWKLNEVWKDKMAITPTILGNRLMWQRKIESI